MRKINLLFNQLYNLIKIKAKLRRLRNEQRHYDSIRDVFYVEESCGQIYVMCNGVAVTKFSAQENIHSLMQVLQGMREIGVEYERRKQDKKQDKRGRGF